MISAGTRRVALDALLASQASASPSPVADGEAVVAIRAFAVPGVGERPGYSVLEVETRSGIKGYGEARPLSRANVQDLSQLAGKAAYAYEALTRIAPEPARGGLNMALLDIVGKMTNAPVYRLIGGPTRFKARAIARLSGSSDAELKSDLQKQMASGVRAFAIPVTSPVARNQGSEFVKMNVERLNALREQAPGADFVVEASDQLTPSDASMLAAALQPLHPLWLDQPCPVRNLDTLRKISFETVVPLGFGREIRDPGVFQDLLREGLIDVVQPDLLTFGISGVCRIAAMAETYYTAVVPWHEAGPIATMAALHAAAAMPNFFALRVPASGPGDARIVDGFFELPTGPGLGVTVDTKTWERNRIA
jgi:galactonate dehydratase